ncbi:hypothetical protein SAMN05444062_104322 [Pseudomonas syringae]|nr:hypothetical protein SAMN05444062_104322 [Pseudomonas syringae]
MILPNGHRSGLVREGVAKPSNMHRLNDRLREQVRSYPSGRRPFLILPNERRSGLVREGAAKPSNMHRQNNRLREQVRSYPSGRRRF